MKVTITKQVEQQTEVNIELPYYGVFKAKHDIDYYIAALSEERYVTVTDLKIVTSPVYIIQNGNNTENQFGGKDYTQITTAEFLQMYAKASKNIEDELNKVIDASNLLTNII